MKRIIPLSILCGLLSTLAAIAAVPSLINYQGRLTDSNGDPVTGSKTFAVSIHDASSGGNLLYSEAIGAVTLDAKGIYSFQFGGAGTSNTATTETVATTDGAATSYQKVLSNLPVVSGSISVTDGTYTWDQTAGSSNNTEFDVVYSEALSRVTVLYYNGTPAAEIDITVSYLYASTGIAGALTSGGEHWMELSVNGTPQATRDRLLIVPFAYAAKIAQTANKADEADRLSIKSFVDIPFNNFNGRFLPYEIGGNGGPYLIVSRPLPVHIKKIKSIELAHTSHYSTQTWSQALNLMSVDKDGNQVSVASVTGHSSTISSSHILDHQKYEYYLSFSVPATTTIHSVRLTYDGLSVK